MTLTGNGRLSPGAGSDSVAGLLKAASQLAAVSETPELDAQLLLADVIGCSRAALVARPEQRVHPDQVQRFAAAIQRRQQGEPLAYILGRKGFWDFDLLVDPRVLIPRPETELLVEQALECLRDRSGEPVELLEPGTGSGAIALALARHSQSWRVTASDVSAAGLALASANAARLAVSNITFVQSDWLTAFGDRRFDLIVSNPPYIARRDPHLQQDGLPYEPLQALVGGDDGLDCLRLLISQAVRNLRSGGWLLVEHGFDQRKPVARLMSEAGYSAIRSWQDLAGLDRVSAGRIPDK